MEKKEDRKGGTRKQKEGKRRKGRCYKHYSNNIISFANKKGKRGKK